MTLPAMAEPAAVLLRADEVLRRAAAVVAVVEDHLGDNIALCLFI
jgi:hypothetical protein